MFAREGYALIAGSAVIGLVIAASAVWFLGGWAMRAPALVAGLGVFAFTLYFFRDPDRSPPESALDGATFLAPADGKVVEVVEEEEPLYLQGPSKRVSIFLSPLNVHVNRVPANGVIEFVRYVAGDYLVAWHPKASEKNERSEIGMRHESGTPILFKQIAGAVARRIVYHVKEGDAVTAGKRFGIVKFGSRMDVHVPPHVTLDVDVGQTVRAGETVIGAFPEETSVAHDAAATASRNA